MKKTDVTQPVAMATPFAEGVYSATSTEDFEIPAATSTTADDSCVMDDGFLPITSTALDDGGKAPERKNFNGMFYLSTDQRFFLQNGGFITYNPDVATAIGGYPQDAILDFIDSNGNYKKVRSLIDDNSNNFVADETLIDGTNWEEIQMGGDTSNLANTDLSNLTTAGNSRLQYAPFAINAGTVVNGENETLYTPTTPIEVSWTQPVLTSNGTLGGNSFAVGGMPAYSSGYQLWYMFDDGTANNRYESASLPAYFTFYNPKPIKVTNLRIVNNVERTDRSPKLYRVSGSNDNSAWTQLTEGTNTVLSHNASWNIDLSNNTNFYKYYKVDITSHSDWNVSTGWVVEVGNVYITAVEQAFVGTNLICDACTITTTDGRSKSFENSSTLDITGTADGTYSVFKDYTDGSLSLLSDSNFNLDTSTVPANLYVNNVINNNLVMLGTCTVSSNLITDVNNVLINNGWAFAVTTRYITETYHNGASFYRVYSDGFCIQGGFITNSSDTQVTVTLLKPYLNTNYNLQITINTAGAPYTSGAAPMYFSASYKTASSFQCKGYTSSALADKTWIAFGYIA